MIVAIVTEKGGTGKTTLDTNLAGMRVAAGYRTLPIDADRQGNSNFWPEIRAGALLLGIEPSLYGDRFPSRR